MTEEASMAEAIKIIAPKMLPTTVEHLVLTHEGRSDLRKSIPLKLRGMKKPGDRFITRSQLLAKLQSFPGRHTTDSR
jgi:hypothetical protein